MDTMHIHISIPADIQTALCMLKAAGFEAFLVGGCVRDALLGQQADDFDIATNARPEQLIALFAPAYKLITTGQKHGTIAPVIHHRPVEITTYRIDGMYSDSRHPDSVVFSAALKDDLSRRDFTMNALAYSEATGIVDLFGGVQDVVERRIRCVGTPQRRFEEDALRIMRALRFSAVLGFEIEKETACAIRSRTGDLAHVSVERLYAEWKKLLGGDYAGAVLEAFPCLIQTLFGFCLSARKIAALKAQTQPQLKQVILFIGEDVSALEALKPDKASLRFVQRMTRLYAQPLTAAQRSPEGLALFVYENGADRQTMEQLLRLHACLEDAFDPSLYPLDEVYNRRIPVRVSMLAIGGGEVAACGYNGEEIGRALDMLTRAVIVGQCENTAEDLKRYLKTKKG